MRRPLLPSPVDAAHLGVVRKTSYDDGIRANVDAVLKTPVAA